jgi:hypothetical protein
MTNKKKPPAGHGWKPGQSGNPKGRPKGSCDVAQLRAAIAAQLPQLLQSMLQRALEGDVAAARLLLERTVAPLKATDLAQPIHLPDDTLTQQGRAVMAAVSAGELAPSQGAALVGAFGALARVVELDELAARVAELEKQRGTS